MPEVWQGIFVIAAPTSTQGEMTMKHHNGCTDCKHNKKRNAMADWHCTEVDRVRIEAKYQNGMFNCFDYEQVESTDRRTN